MICCLASGPTMLHVSRIGLHPCPRLHMTIGGRSSRALRFASLVRSASSDQSPSSDTEEYEYDLFTIGAGTGGVRASRATADFGKKVGLCELPFAFVSSEQKGGIGGTCVLRGCVPKKLMVYASEYAGEFHDSVGFGWEDAHQLNHNWSKFMDAKRQELRRLNGVYRDNLNKSKVEIIEGRGKILDAHTVDVDGRRITARNILVAVGGASVRPPIPGAEFCITSDEMLEIPERPKKLTVIGGGYIGMEFSGIFRRFGTDVHTIYRQKKPLAGFDEEVREFFHQQIKATGLNLYPESSPTEIKKQPDGRITVLVQLPDKSMTEIKDNDYVLLATGRASKTKGLGLEQVGVALGKKGEIVVDEYNRTNVPSIYAIGDVAAKKQLTPVALMEGMALAKTLGLGQPTKPDYTNIPSAVFAHPNLATVGLTEEAALEKFGDVDVYSTSFRGMRNTIGGSALKSMMKLVVDQKTDKVVGAHMVGEHAAEILQGFAIAIKAGVTKTVLDSTVGIHPTAAEEFVTLRSATRQLRGGKKAELTK